MDNSTKGIIYGLLYGFFGNIILTYVLKHFFLAPEPWLTVITILILLLGASLYLNFVKYL